MKKNEGVAAVREDEGSDNYRIGKNKQRMQQVSAFEHREERRSLRHDDHRRQDCHAQHVPEVPGTKHLPPGRSGNLENGPPGPERTRDSGRSENGDQQKGNEGPALGEIQR